MFSHAASTTSHGFQLAIITVAAKQSCNLTLSKNVIHLAHIDQPQFFAHSRGSNRQASLQAHACFLQCCKGVNGSPQAFQLHNTGSWQFCSMEACRTRTYDFTTFPQHVAGFHTTTLHGQRDVPLLWLARRSLINLYLPEVR